MGGTQHKVSSNSQFSPAHKQLNFEVCIAMESLKCVRMLRRPNFKLKFYIVYNHYGGTPKSALTTKKLYGLPVVGGVPRNGRSYLLDDEGGAREREVMGRGVRIATPPRSPFYPKRSICVSVCEACSSLINPNEHPARVRVLEIPCRRHTCQAQPNAVLTSRRGRAASRCSVNR